MLPSTRPGAHRLHCLCWLQALRPHRHGLGDGLGECLGGRLARLANLLGGRARPVGGLARLARLANLLASLRWWQWHDGEWRDAMREGKDETS